MDVNALVALAWDSHVHHAAVRGWFRVQGRQDWATCPVSESGFVRVSCNPQVLPHPIAAGTAREVLDRLRGVGRHRFLSDDVSPTDPDFPQVHGHRQVTDAHLLTLARRHHAQLITFDTGLAQLAGGTGVKLLPA